MFWFQGQLHVFWICCSNFFFILLSPMRWCHCNRFSLRKIDSCYRLYTTFIHMSFVYMSYLNFEIFHRTQCTKVAWYNFGHRENSARPTTSYEKKEPLPPVLRKWTCLWHRHMRDDHVTQPWPIMGLETFLPTLREVFLLSLSLFHPSWATATPDQSLRSNKITWGQSHDPIA